MTPCSIQRGSRHDLAAARALLQTSGLPTQGLTSDHLLLACAGSEIVGTAALEIYLDGVLLRSVAVDAQHRGTGIGTGLTEAALDEARSSGATAAYLLTTTAAPFFEQRGFRILPRSEVPESIRQSVEFESLCPSSAAAMVRSL